MTSSPKNCKVFKECGGAQVLYIILEYPSTRQYATGNYFCYAYSLIIKTRTGGLYTNQTYNIPNAKHPVLKNPD